MPPQRGTPANICMHLIFPETGVIGLHFCNWVIAWVYLHSNLCSVLQKTHLFCNRVRFGRSRSSKVNDFGTNRKRVCNFLLVINSNYGPILHRFWDMATYWLKIVNFSYPSLIRRPCSLFPLEFRAEVNHEETRVMGLSSREDRMIVAGVVLTQCQRVTDRQTDGQTDVFTIANTADAL